jgi:hypothetical protein
MVGGRVIGFALVALLTLLLAGRLTMPVPAPAHQAAQPVVGRAITVTGLVFDGARYTSAPISVGATMEQPIVGRASTVTGLVFDGARYVSAPIAVGKPRAERSYTVTALIYDGTTYRSAPVQVGGH